MNSGNGFFFLLNLWRFLSAAERSVQSAADTIIRIIVIARAGMLLFPTTMFSNTFMDVLLTCRISIVPTLKK